VKVLFVCLGNICRSPTAEAVFRELAERQGHAGRFHVDSAGTGDWHVGEAPDGRMRRAAEGRGYALEGRARQVRPEDFEHFDHVLAMDRANLRELLRVAPAAQHPKIRLLRDLDPHGGDDVPDPYHGGAEGFDEVVTILERSCAALLEELAEGREDGAG
jgi:protein-tyrosine phosphatase